MDGMLQSRLPMDAAAPSAPSHLEVAFCREATIAPVIEDSSCHACCTTFWMQLLSMAIGSLVVPPV